MNVFAALLKLAIITGFSVVCLLLVSIAGRGHSVFCSRFSPIRSLHFSRKHIFGDDIVHDRSHTQTHTNGTVVANTFKCVCFVCLRTHQHRFHELVSTHAIRVFIKLYECNRWKKAAEETRCATETGTISCVCAAHTHVLIYVIRFAALWPSVNALTYKLF